MLIPVNPEELKKIVDTALNVATDKMVRTQLAKLSSDLYYAREMLTKPLNYVLLTPEEIRLALEFIPIQGMEQKEH